MIMVYAIYPKHITTNVCFHAVTFQRHKVLKRCFKLSLLHLDHYRLKSNVKAKLFQFLNPKRTDSAEETARKVPFTPALSALIHQESVQQCYVLSSHISLTSFSVGSVRYEGKVKSDTRVQTLIVLEVLSRQTHCGTMLLQQLLDSRLIHHNSNVPQRFVQIFRISLDQREGHSITAMLKTEANNINSIFMNRI